MGNADAAAAAAQNIEFWRWLKRGRPLPCPAARRWRAELGRPGAAVLVMTPQILLDLLSHALLPGGVARLDALCLDEVHHCTGRHPYAQIMQLVAAAPPGAPCPLGCPPAAPCQLAWGAQIRKTRTRRCKTRTRLCMRLFAA
jgi:hypothetical protein